MTAALAETEARTDWVSMITRDRSSNRRALSLTLGLVIGVVVLAASAHDNTAGTALLDQAAARHSVK